MTDTTKQIQGRTGPWEMVLGLEVHAQVASNAKLFSGAAVGFGAGPNMQVALVDAAMPGMLPVINKHCVEQAVKTGLGLKAQINLKSLFDRKNYFYPDLPQGYQISQFKDPIVGEGEVLVERDDGTTFTVRHHNRHLRADAGKSLHDQDPNATYVDLNRAGTALMEIVSRPDMRTAEEAAAYVKKLRTILVYLGTCDGDMEKGNLRCDANVSVRRVGETKFGTRCEIKNVNSVRFVMKAIEYEAQRQVDLIEAGGTVDQETRLFDSSTGETRTMRSKEDAHDYRYFPEPDIPPFDFSEEYIAGLRRTLPELPDAKAERFVNEYQLPVADVVILTEEKEFSAYFEEVASELADKKASGEMQAEIPRAVKLAANYMLTEIRKHLSERGEKTKDIPFTPENYAEFISLIADKKINSSAAQSVLAEMYQGGDNDPSHIVSRLNLAQVSDTGELEGVVDGVLAANAKSVADFQAGKENAFQYLIGQVMKETKGKANPEVVTTLLRTKLSL